jgi:hypothetical protein
MTDSISPERMKIIREHLAGTVQGGEEFIVRWEAGDLAVETLAAYSPLRNSHPELYGQLLSASQRIADAPRNSLLVATVLWFVACLVVGASLVDRLFGVAINNFQHVGLYLGLGLLCFVVVLRYNAYRERAAYQALRDDVERVMVRANLEPETVLAWIESDASVASVAKQLKGDQQLFGRR